MKILFITLSNIGDCILTLPALDYLRSLFPQGRITCLVGIRPKEIFENSPQVERIVVYDKHAGLKEKIKLFFAFKRGHFDLVIDLRNTLFGVLLPSKISRRAIFKRLPGSGAHMKDKHLRAALIAGLTPSGAAAADSICIKTADDEYIAQILARNGIGCGERFVVVAPGARSNIKRWPKEKFLELCRKFHKLGIKTVLAGDTADSQVCAFIEREGKPAALDLCAKTNIRQLAALLKKAALVVTNDSAVMHLASYLDLPVTAVFGPTNEDKYGPWSQNKRVVKKEIFCRPCEKAQCRFASAACLSKVRTEDVFKAAVSLLKGEKQPAAGKYSFKRILIVRTDRIGDVIISTPVIKALREAYPNAYLAMLVSPYTRELLESNPYLDETIVYDKDNKHKSWLSTLRFALRLKQKRFDLAVVLHPTNRAHLIAYLAGIPMRIGWRRKLSFLLSKSIAHTKQEGSRHELEYNLDLLKLIGIEAQEKGLFISLRPQDEQWVKELFASQGIKSSDPLLAIHPGASCVSKLWPPERFANVADELVKLYGFKILLVSSPKDAHLCRKVAQNMQAKALDLSGRTSIMQLAALLQRCRLFISNDSGPVHVACAVGTPVISIFGRNQKGLGPVRWGPSGKTDIALHKDVGCTECLAHNCRKDFLCLKAISVEEVVLAARRIISPPKPKVEVKNSISS